MKYLLSTGSTTTDKIQYLKDLIRTNMLIRTNEIPYWNGGTSELITSIDQNALTANITSIMTDLCMKLKNQFNNISLSLDSVTISGSKVNVVININGINETYVIIRRY